MTDPGPPRCGPVGELDTTALCVHAEVLTALAEWTDKIHAVLGDLGYEREQAALSTSGRPLTANERHGQRPTGHPRGRLAERGNARLKTT